MAHRVKMLATKTEDLSPSLVTCIVGEENQRLQIIFWSPHVYHRTHTQTHKERERFLMIYFVFMYMHLPVWVHMDYMHAGAYGGQGYQIPSDWSYRLLCKAWASIDSALFISYPAILRGIWAMTQRKMQVHLNGTFLSSSWSPLRLVLHSWFSIWKLFSALP